MYGKYIKSYYMFIPTIVLYKVIMETETRCVFLSILIIILSVIQLKSRLCPEINNFVFTYTNTKCKEFHEQIVALRSGIIPDIPSSIL